ncbi:hypothetical protein VP236O401_P0029 [Vibrio phage 236O40-1]|nr:hypothetical protein VP236O401_P0029 [Vibrio phage 236O40-1]
MINLHRIEKRNTIIERGLPIYTFDKKVDGEELTISLASMIKKSGGESHSISLIYKGFTLPTRLHGKNELYLADYDDKYGVIEGNDGFIYLGVNDESDSQSSQSV